MYVSPNAEEERGNVKYPYLCSMLDRKIVARMMFLTCYVEIDIVTGWYLLNVCLVLARQEDLIAK